MDIFYTNDLWHTQIDMFPLLFFIALSLGVIFYIMAMSCAFGLVILLLWGEYVN